MIPYARQSISDEDIEAVATALRTSFLTQGPRVAEFERRLAEAVGARYAVAVNSGTAALHTAYFAAGIAPGKTVLTSPITFVATANASRYLGGNVRLADIDIETALLDPAAIHRTAVDSDVIAPVHLAGHVANMPEIAAAAARSGAIVVEDAAHALGASYRDSAGVEFRVGACAHSSMCCFSFHAVKHITTGEGGAVCTNDEDLYRKMVRFRSHGITRERTSMTGGDGPWYYEQHDLGFNYRLTDFQCALGASQLSRLDSFVARRRTVAAQYDEAFAQVAGVSPVMPPPWSRSSYHLYVVRVDPGRRRSIYEALRSAGIEANVHYIPLHRQPFYSQLGRGGDGFPAAEAYYARALSLPMFGSITDDEVAEVIAAVGRAVA